MHCPSWKHCVLLSVLLCSFAAAERPPRNTSGLNRYISRPDIRAPQWEVTVHDKSRVAPGYWFVAPFENIGQSEAGESWIGPHIYDANGELVWSGSKLFSDWNVYDFRVSTVLGEERMTLVNGRDGHAIVMGDDYRIQNSWHMGTLGVNLNVHELNFVENGTRVLIANEAHKKASAAFSNAVDWPSGDCNTLFQGFQEIDVETWSPVFSWSSSNHVGMNESTYLEGSLSSRCNGSWGWDYFHMNSIDKSIDGDYFISGRHVDTIYKISGKDGSIMWRLGGEHSDFQMNGLRFSRQHDIRYRGQNDTHTFLSFLDNAKGLDKNKPTYKFSRGVLVALQTNTKPMVATVQRYIDHPEGDEHYAFRRGNLQLLPNGNIWMDWSEQALQSEHSPDGTLVMQAKMATDWLGTYRSYKFPFVGRPSEAIAVHSQALDSSDNTTRTLVHASWNGATEVASWSLYKTTHTGELRVFLANMPRYGFETALAYNGFATYVVIDALDAAGNVLASSDIFKTIAPMAMTANVADEVIWLQAAAAKQAEALGADAQQAMDEAAADDYLSSSLAINSTFASLFIIGFVASAGIVALLLWRIRSSGSSAADLTSVVRRLSHRCGFTSEPYREFHTETEMERRSNEYMVSEVHVYSDK